MRIVVKQYAFMVRVKMQGKSLRSGMATFGKGKPCMLKCHVVRRSRAARPMSKGRQNEVLSNQHPR